MNSFVKSSVVMASAAALALAGSVYAFAGWNSIGAPTVLSIRTVEMPAGNVPSVDKQGRNAAIDWVGNQIVPGVKVDSYVVTRFGAGGSVVVCDRVTATSCKDKLVPGGTWTWRVQPVFASWTGAASAGSAALTFSGPPPTAAELVSATSPAAPGPPAASPAGTTPPGGGPVVVTSPPAPPGGAKPPVVPEPEPEEPDVPPPPAPQQSGPVEPSPSVSPSADGPE